LTGVCFIHNKLGIQYSFLSIKNILISQTRDIKLGTFPHNTLKLRLNPEANISNNILYNLNKVDNIRAVSSILIKLIKPLSGFLNTGSLTPIHLDQ